MLELALELQIAVPPLSGQRPVFERGLDGAAGLSVVGTVGELAMCEALRHVFESPVDTVVGNPELELADARGVDHESACRELYELATGRRVATFAVVANLLCREQLLACQGVDECRLADTRRPK